MMRGKIHSTVAKSSNLRRECFVSLVCMTSVFKDMNRWHALSRKYWNDSCLWLTAGHVMGDPFEISTLRREVSLSCLEPSLPGLLNWILSGMFALKSLSTVGLLWFHWRTQGEHQVISIFPSFPSLSFEQRRDPRLQGTPYFYFGSASLLTSRSESSAWCDQLSPLSYCRLSVCLKKASGARGHQSATSLKSNVRCRVLLPMT